MDGENFGGNLGGRRKSQRSAEISARGETLAVGEKPWPPATVLVVGESLCCRRKSWMSVKILTFSSTRWQKSRPLAKTLAVSENLGGS